MSGGLGLEQVAGLNQNEWRFSLEYATSPSCEELCAHQRTETHVSSVTHVVVGARDRAAVIAMAMRRAAAAAVAPA